MTELFTVSVFKSNLPRLALVGFAFVGLAATGLRAQPQQQDSPADRIKQLERQIAQQKRAMRDWGGTLRYGSDNSELAPPKPGEDRVVFFGDQITDFWSSDEKPFFPGKPWLNRGIAGQTTDQMLIRFRQDVIALQPKVVVILAGLNDVAGIHGVLSEQVVMDNLTSMAELARANRIRVVLASLTPVCDCFSNQTSRRRLQERISEINELIEDYAKHTGAVYLDYFSALADGNDFKKTLTKDGVIPNEAGYKVMADLVERAISKSLAGKE
jgi:lysophospholipase L1-like esterase